MLILAHQIFPIDPDVALEPWAVLPLTLAAFVVLPLVTRARTLRRRLRSDAIAVEGDRHA